MVERIRVDGFDPFMAEVVKHDGKAVFALFSGSVGADGRSWCSDCVSAEPVVEEGLKAAPEGAVFIQCSVGERAFWKDKSNIFRTNPKLKLTGVPTLMRWGTPQRLGDSDCSKIELVKMLFEED